MVYKAAYKMMPPIRLSQPSNTTWNAFSINLAPSLTRMITAKNMMANAIKGNHLDETLTVSFKYAATTAESFNAAARPIIKAIMEKTAMIKPF